MLKYIGIKLQIEGLHSFPNVEEMFGKEVSYLKYLHRHNYFIECELEVNDLNREKEFIVTKHNIQRYLQKYYDETYCCLNFGAMSCEMIAVELFNEFGLNLCIVSEDNENYAKIIK